MKPVKEESYIDIYNIHTLGDLCVLRDLIGSLSRTIHLRASW